MCYLEGINGDALQVSSRREYCDTVQSIRIERLEWLMGVCQVREAMRQALRLKADTGCKAWQAAARFGVSEAGVLKTEKKLVQKDLEAQEVYCESLFTRKDA